MRVLRGNHKDRTDTFINYLLCRFIFSFVALSNPERTYKQFSGVSAKYSERNNVATNFVTIEVTDLVIEPKTHCQATKLYDITVNLHHSI